MLFPERNEIPLDDPDFWRKYFSAFRRELRYILMEYRRNNPGSSDDELLKDVKDLVLLFNQNKLEK